jgi:hypothetical protein
MMTIIYSAGTSCMARAASKQPIVMVKRAGFSASLSARTRIRGR